MWNYLVRLTKLTAIFIACADRVTIDFKSYKGHHVLGLSDSYFTSIVGPNGSGKSNSYANYMDMMQDTTVANEM